MTRKRTATIAKSMFEGAKLYQQRAQLVLPILVRQALSSKKITYKSLSSELGIPNARNLNYILGSVGATLSELNKEKKWATMKIPQIQCLVVNQNTGLPGEGVDGLIMSEQTREKLSPVERELRIKMLHEQIYTFTEWHAVLESLKLKAVTSAPSVSTVFAPAVGGRGGGESKEHRNLKNLVAKNPALVGLPAAAKSGRTEFYLPSGDSVDVLFQEGHLWVAVEVKAMKSDKLDVQRGLFQCVKYMAVLKAWRGSLSETADVRSVLVLEGAFPESLIGLRNSLGIEVIASFGARPRTLQRLS